MKPKKSIIILRISLLSITLFFVGYFLLEGFVSSFGKKEVEAIAYDLDTLIDSYLLKEEIKDKQSYKESELDKLGYQGTKVDAASILLTKDGGDFAIYKNHWCATKFQVQTEIVLTREKSAKDCTLDGFSWMELADKSNASSPILSDEMIPIKWNGTTWVKASERNEKGTNEWYQYEEKKWANVAIVAPEVKEKYLELKEGEEIKDQDVIGYFVWIPRFRYQIFNYAYGEMAEKQINIKFENCRHNKSKAEKNGDWITHPAFERHGQEIDGFWVAKYPSGYQESTDVDHVTIPSIKDGQLVSKPGVTPWSNISLANVFKVSTAFAKDLDSDASSYPLRNSEWGAILYLTQSQYGRCQDGTCEKVETNPNQMTGCGTEKECTSYQKEEGMKTSTTGNVTGVYDLAKNLGEIVMAVQKEKKTEEDKDPLLPIQNSGFDPEELNSDKIKKELDLYSYGTTKNDQDAYNRSNLGDALGETRGWYQGEALFMNDQASYLLRGKKGMFSFTSFDGKEKSNFRIVLEIEN